MPCRLVRGKNRKFNPAWLHDHKWMIHSVSTDSIYCVYCALFSTQRNDAKDRTFVSSPVCDWSKMSKLSKRHVKEGANHYAFVQMAENFLRVARGEQLCVADQFNVQNRQLVEKNRQILIEILEVIILCGRQSLPIRGHSEVGSNFIAILSHHAKYSPLMSHHLQHANPCMKYTSPDVQNELIRLCGLAILDPLVNACNNSIFYGFIADEATDVSTMEYIAICTRYLVRNRATNRLEITEEFLGFVEAGRMTGETLATRGIRDRGGEDAQPRIRRRWQIRRGVQVRIRQVIPGAVYTHCKAHNVNLAIVHASTEPLVRTMMDTVQHIAFSFNYSAKRLRALQAELELDEGAQAGMRNRAKLQSLC